MVRRHSGVPDTVRDNVMELTICKFMCGRLSQVRCRRYKEW
jgi:hypothetical protein